MWNIHNMQNMSTCALSIEQVRFIDDLSALLMTWNMPAHAARVYGYLLLCNAPASLDDIARDLEMSRSNAFNAARVLEQSQNIRRSSERGSKRIFFEASDDPGAPLRRQTETLGRMSALIAASREAVADGEAGERLGRLAAFHADLKAAMETVILPSA